MDAAERGTRMLERWAEAVEKYWFEPPGLYGPGYIHWGVQSNWNYMAAMATLGETSPRWRGRALDTLRYLLATHATGARPGTDGKRWGRSWISMLGMERGAHGLALLRPHMTGADASALKRALLCEADWLLNHAERGSHKGVQGGMWASEGRNNPESNVWSGALLWRVAEMYPRENDAEAWRELAHSYLVNGVSVPADAEDATVLEGKTIAERHVGANFFPSYALDHHGYLNVGYMTICASNAAMLHFDLKRAGLGAPATLHHHQADLWRALRRMVFEDGRLARVGGDSRFRYAYCQEYLLPSLLYAADRLGDGGALGLAERQLALMEAEHTCSPDGTFYGRRLADYGRRNPHYYCRLESDRAAALSMLVNYLPLVKAPEGAAAAAFSPMGVWSEPEHGAAIVRGERRLASFSWRAFGLTQAMCQPPDDGSLAEWGINLCPVVRFLGDDRSRPGAHRQLLSQSTRAFEGGFVTSGSVMEGVDCRIDEGGNCTDQAVTRLAFAALPDDRTCLALQHVRCSDDRTGWIEELKGLHLNIPNDFHNGFRRRFRAESGEIDLAPAEREETFDLGGRWASVDDKLAVVMLAGGDRLSLVRSPGRRGQKYPSLFIEELCSTVTMEVRRSSPGEVLLDLGFAALSGAGADVAASLAGGAVETGSTDVKGVWAEGADGRRYALVANFGGAAASATAFGRGVELAPGAAELVAE